MSGHRALGAVLCFVVIAASSRLGLRECRAGSIQDLLDNSNGMITSGNLALTFTNDSVTSDPAGNPTAAQIDVTAVAGGLMFRFNPFLDLTTPDAKDQYVSITYSVTAPRGIARVGLSFTGTAVDVNTKSEVTKTFAGRNESLNVFVMQDAAGKTTEQKNQSVDFADLPKTLSVTDTGHLATGVRGNGATSTAQLYDMTNTFAVVPEPSGLVLGSIAALAGLGGWWRGSRRSSG